MKCILCNSKNIKKSFNRNNMDYFICEECDLVFMDPSSHPTINDYKSRYGKHKNDPNEVGYRKSLLELANPCFEFINKKSKCLDYGCGPTRAMASIFEEKGFNMQSYDLYFYPDLSKTKYDLITCNEVIEHFSQPRAEFKKLNSLLNFHGTLAVGTNLWNNDTDFKTWHYLTDFTHTSIYSLRTLDYISKEFGFELIEILKNRVIIFRKTLKNSH